VTRPVRALAACGVRATVLANTAGSTRAALSPGSLLVSRDVFHWMGARVRMSGAVPPRDARGDDVMGREAAMANGAMAAAAEHGIPLRAGVLAAGLGPTYETAAEVRMLRRMGADALTMSTVPEFGAARAAGLAVLVFTVITNHATGVLPGAHLTHREVTENGARAARGLALLLNAVAEAAATTAPSG
jgi:purine-nucleoside phosphorylase